MKIVSFKYEVIPRSIGSSAGGGEDDRRDILDGRGRRALRTGVQWMVARTRRCNGCARKYGRKIGARTRRVVLFDDDGETSLPRERRAFAPCTLPDSRA